MAFGYRLLVNFLLLMFSMGDIVIYYDVLSSDKLRHPGTLSRFFKVRSQPVFLQVG